MAAHVYPVEAQKPGGKPGGNPRHGDETMRTAETLTADSELSIDDLDKVAGGCESKHSRKPDTMVLEIMTDDDGDGKVNDPHTITMITAESATISQPTCDGENPTRF